MYLVNKLYDMEITKQENCKDSQSIQRGSTWGESEVSHLLSLWSTEKVMQAMQSNVRKACSKTRHACAFQGACFVLFMRLFKKFRFFLIKL